MAKYLGVFATKNCQRLGPMESLFEGIKLITGSLDGTEPTAKSIRLYVNKQVSSHGPAPDRELFAVELPSSAMAVKRGKWDDSALTLEYNDASNAAISTTIESRRGYLNIRLPGATQLWKKRYFVIRRDAGRRILCHYPSSSTTGNSEQCLGALVLDHAVVQTFVQGELSDRCMCMRVDKSLCTYIKQTPTHTHTRKPSMQIGQDKAKNKNRNKNNQQKQGAIHSDSRRLPARGPRPGPLQHGAGVVEPQL